MKISAVVDLTFYNHFDYLTNNLALPSSSPPDRKEIKQRHKPPELSEGVLLWAYFQK